MKPYAQIVKNLVENGSKKQKIKLEGIYHIICSVETRYANFYHKRKHAFFIRLYHNCYDLLEKNIR